MTSTTASRKACQGGVLSERVRNSFRFRTLRQPTITPELRNKVIGAYDHISELLSFLTPDVHLGKMIFSTSSGNSKTIYNEYEQTYNSVLLGTLLNCILNGSMIFFGPPGSGKTTAPEVVGQVLCGLELKEIQSATVYGHTNLTETHITGGFDIPKLMIGIKEVIWTSWVINYFRMLDEVNRIPPEISAILMQAVDRRRIAYAGVTHDMAFGPIYATANYLDEGNFPMTRPFLDRFAISVHARGLNAEDIDQLFMVQEELDCKTHALLQAEREQIQAEVHSIAIDPKTLALLAHIISGLSSCELAGNDWSDKNKGLFGEQKTACVKEKCGFQPELVLCSQINEQMTSTRAVQALRDYSRALAWFLGRDQVDNEIMSCIFPLVFAHRVTPSKIAMNGGESAAGVEIDKSLFVRKTFDFTRHLWEVGNRSFEAQNPIYTEIENFYRAIREGAGSAASLLAESEAVISKVVNMEDPAKFNILLALHKIREGLRKIRE